MLTKIWSVVFEVVVGFVAFCIAVLVLLPALGYTAVTWAYQGLTRRMRVGEVFLLSVGVGFAVVSSALVGVLAVIWLDIVFWFNLSLFLKATVFLCAYMVALGQGMWDIRELYWMRFATELTEDFHD